jgi:hypothetical protein
MAHAADTWPARTGGGAFSHFSAKHAEFSTVRPQVHSDDTIIIVQVYTHPSRGEQQVSAARIQARRQAPQVNRQQPVVIATGRQRAERETRQAATRR